MKIYTRTGDTGETGLLDGRRVSKAAPRVDAYGEVDELNACLGLLLSTGLQPDLVEVLTRAQHQLFSLGAELADPGGNLGQKKASVAPEEIAALEEAIDKLENELQPLRRFILPGGHPSAAAAHLARAVCRRAERRMTGLGNGEVSAASLAYVNRLSDLLFVMARTLNVRQGVTEQEW
ncbi:MAG: ATP:cob(I)alamin adenosyltransferase [Acidobacteria bacterium]|nr:ATP:cob(I)alamin adenosyltransferase [Acidobacteriota bacterium]